MDSKVKKLREKAEKMGIELDANETISDLEAKISSFKPQKKAPEKPKRGRVIKNKTFIRRIDREVKKNG